MNPRTRSIGSAASLAAAMALVAAPAFAFGITGLSFGLVGNTPDEIANSGSNRSQIASSTSILTAPTADVDVAGAMSSFETRFAWLVAVDRENSSGSAQTKAPTAAYQITFSVDNPLGGDYEIEIDTSWLGALTLVDDVETGTASATIGAVSGTVNAAPAAGFALDAVGPLSGATTTTQLISQSGSTVVVMGSGTSDLYTLAFTWSGSATSNKNEAAIRLGLPGGLSTTTADDYPGVGGRTAANDGHFVAVNATLLAVPEPHSLALLGLGLAGLAFVARQR